MNRERVCDQAPAGGASAAANVVAIDGPAASGKSTVARHVAARLERLYVDSGALYRAITWNALETGIDVRDNAAVARLAESFPIEFFEKEGSVWFRVEGDEPDRELRADQINDHVSLVAAVSRVRSCVVSWLRGLVRFGPLVMEGRDIGTVVFPDSPWKFYLDASPEERARRRHAESEGGSAPGGVEKVSDSLRRRDRMDSGRKTDPLRTASGAAVIDSTNLGIDEVVDLIARRVRASSSA